MRKENPDQQAGPSGIAHVEKIGGFESADFKQVQETLDESRQRLSVILDSIADGFFAIDRQWRFTHINDAALRHFRRTREEVQGKYIFDVFPAARRTIFEDRYRQAMESGEPVHFESGSLLGDKTMEVHAYPGRENLTVLFRDITERHQMQQALDKAHRQAEWLARFPEENPSPVVRVSMKGMVQYANPAARAPFWLCKEGEPPPEPLRSLVTKALALGKETQEDVRLGERFYSISVVPFPAEAYAHVYGIDITKRKCAEDALRNLNADLEERVSAQVAEITKIHESVKIERQRFYDVLELLPAYVVLLTPDCQVPFANRFFRERFGEAKGRRCHEYLFQRTTPCDVCETYTVMKTGKPHHWEWIGPDGRNYDVYDFPFSDSNGAPFVLEMGIDVTDMKRVTAALEEANETLEQRVADRTAELEIVNRELESFSYSVSHDLRAPLRAIDGFSRMILRRREKDFDAETARQFKVIQDNARAMGQLIDDLLSFSRLTRKEIINGSLDMERMIRSAWSEMMSEHPDRNARLVLHDLPRSLGDQALIRQVILNLLSNAVKFSRSREQAVIEVGANREAKRNVYFIRDNGVGFDMRYQDKLFGVFQRLHRAEEFEGTGVGLAIVERIIHRHGGTVWAEGKVDDGATFYFTLAAEE